MHEFRTGKLPFKPRARLLLLLGDQLIRDPGIAVFELVKNAYDADSPHAKVTMTQVTDANRGRILVEDSGTGMDYQTVTDVWLEPGTDYRVQQREADKRTPKYGRLPLGEKGVGRFAAHKLGRHVTLITRMKNLPEVVVEVEWDRFAQHKYLSDVPIEVSEREPQVFTGKKTGTRIEVTKLRNAWTRGMVRDLARSINSIRSPFEEEGEFKTEFILTENEDWLTGLLTVEQAITYALFRAHCEIRDGQLAYDYEFTPLPAMDKVKPREIHFRDANAINLPSRKIDIGLLKRCVGPIDVDLYIFDREPRILALGVTDKKGLKEFLDQVGGIRVYRGGIRVYDYGEHGNDWLNLGGQRVNVPTRRISNNLVIGAVSLDLASSPGLVEKTNREGFVDDQVYRAFREAVDFAVTQIESERNKDKTRIRNEYSGKRLKEPVLEDLTELRELIEKKRLTQELGAYLDRIEADFVLIRDRFLTSASAGLSLSVVIHEV
jgi:hypothetical protein